MVQKLRIKLFKKSKNCVYIIVGYNKKSKPTKFISKVGVIMIAQDRKYVFISLKKLGYWLNRGATLNSYVSYLVAYLYYRKEKVLSLKNSLKKKI